MFVGGAGAVAAQKSVKYLVKETRRAVSSGVSLLAAFVVLQSISAAKSAVQKKLGNKVKGE